MLLSKSQRNWLFSLFLILAVASAALEAYIVVRVIDAGKLDALKTIFGAINGTGLALLLRLFIQLLRQEYLSGDSITEHHLANYFRHRLETVSHTGQVESRGAYKALQLGLSHSNLRLLDELLRSCYGWHRYQLSVFANREHPEICCYYDSAGQDLPRSHRFRIEDPDYYRRAKYEVVDLLDAVAPDYVVISNTRDHKSGYAFVNEEQKGRIGSTVLFRFAVDQPGVLVVVSDQGDLFQTSDDRLHSLIAAIGMAIRLEWTLEAKLCLPLAAGAQPAS